MSSWRSGSVSRRGKPSRSASTIVADNASGYHDFKIEGYSRIKNFPKGESLKSSPFMVGGHRWRIVFFPNGDAEARLNVTVYPNSTTSAVQLAMENGCGNATVYVVLDEDITEPVLALYEFAFMVPQRAPFFRTRKVKVSCDKRAAVNRFSSRSIFGFLDLMTRNALETKSGASSSNSLTIRCEVVVFKELCPMEEAASTPTTFVPKSDLIQSLGDLLQAGKGADVVFELGGEKIPAHRCMLAARSPVFSAEFFGTMQESTTTTVGVVRVEDMEVLVFKALLCFLYTDSLPETRKEDEVAMYQHLLVAADRYSVERLKLICEDKLSKTIDVPRVATILTLAEQHHCIVLKKLCLDFLSAPANLKAVMATEGFKHLSTSCPSIKKDLDAMLAS